MSSFFEPPPPPPEPPPEPPRPPWAGAPETMIGRTVALNLVIGRSDKAAVWISAVTAYADGFEFELEIRHRLAGTEVDDPLHPHHRWARQTPAEGLDPGLLRFGLAFSDGRKATNVGPWRPPAPDDTPPEGPMLLSSRGGGGGGGRWHQWYWAWPLPPEGPLAFVCEWPAAEIPETRSEIDSAVVRDAASGVVRLWADEQSRRGSGGWTSYGTAQRVVPASPPTGRREDG